MSAAFDQEAALGFVRRQVDRAVVCRDGLIIAAQTRQHVGASRVKQVISVKTYGVERGESRHWSVKLTNGDAPVERDNV